MSHTVHIFCSNSDGMAERLSKLINIMSHTVHIFCSNSDGMAERLSKLINREKSDLSFWSHKLKTKEKKPGTRKKQYHQY